MIEKSPAGVKQFISMHPILFAADIAKAVQYYLDTLGFQKDWDYVDPPLCASISREGIALHLRQIKPPIQHNHLEEIDTVDYYFAVGDVDLIYREISGRCSNVIYSPVSQEYGMREFYIEDCNGYRLGFGQRVS